MTARRTMLLFAAIGLGCLLLAGLGGLVLRPGWPADAVRMWLLIGTGYLLAAAVIRATPQWWRAHYDEMAALPASRRYMRALWPIMIGFSLTLGLSSWLLRRGVEPTALRAAVALLPALPLVLLPFASLRYLRDIDELQRRIETEAIGIAALLVSLLYFAAGLMVRARVLEFDAGGAMVCVFPLLMAAYGAAKMALVRRYR